MHSKSLTSTEFLDNDSLKSEAQKLFNPKTAGEFVKANHK